MIRKVRPTTIFTSLIAVIMVGWILTATGMPFFAAYHPIIVASITLVLCLWFLVLELTRTSEADTGGGAIDIAADTSIPASVRARKAIRVLAWLLATYVVIWLAGFKLGIVFFISAYVAVEARPRWFVVLGVIAIAMFVMIMMGRFLEVFWLEGWLNQWLQEPLPWLF